MARYWEFTAYSPNRRRLPTGETQQQTGGPATFTLGYGYDANGHLSLQLYPDGQTVAYTPNALGQPTQAGSYATGVQYFPNGAMKQFTYGNGIVHTMQQNARQLPARVTSSGAVVSFSGKPVPTSASGLGYAGGNSSQGS